MFDFASRIIEKWRVHKQAAAQSALDGLKVRYHTFRVLLANNEAALVLLKDLDQMLASSDPSWKNLADEIEELLSVTYELVDGLNRLTGNRKAALYQKHRAISEAVNESLGEIMSKPASGPGCIFFDEALDDPGESVGTKAATLAVLRRDGFPVPAGFAVTARACGDFLSAGGLDLFIREKSRRNLSGEDGGAEMERNAQDIHDRIMEAVLPPDLRDELRRAYERLTSPDSAPVSVRSSALVEDQPEHSFAGQFKTVLNVTSFEAFEEAFKEVLASNFSARSTSYRAHAGLPAAKHDMAVICMHMVRARAAGVLFTVDPVSPGNGRMLISAVPGLGILAVGGSAPADLYRPFRDESNGDAAGTIAQHAVKERRVVARADGGVIEEEVPEAERQAPLLSGEEISALVRCGRRIESLFGAPQDIEWAVADDGRISILQSRNARMAIRNRQTADSILGQTILRAGQTASPGRCVGIARIIESPADLDEWCKAPAPRSILVLNRSLVDAARWMPQVEGVVVELGNPTDHLSCVARENSRPMITGALKATEMLRNGQWIILDADRTTLYQAPKEAWADSVPAAVTAARKNLPAARKSQQSPGFAKLRELIEPLNLTDAYGPTFSILECRSLHDIVRYAHEMAVLEMFEVGDDILEGAESLVHRLDGAVPLHFMLIDLGGGILPNRRGFVIKVEDVVSVPFQALWKGISTPGVRWNQPPSASNISGLFSRAMMDAGSARPVGGQNYALISRDYLNLNARFEFHFTMVDSVCGPNPRENYIRFRFKGGGTNVVQRERRTRCINEIFRANSFFTDLNGDLLTASITETGDRDVQEKLAMVGRLLGFTRLLDAAMSSDDMVHELARAFLEGDFGLERLGPEF